MRLVNKDKLLAPGKCLVCERIPHGRVVDTQIKNFNNAANDPMRGRKYVCDRCGSKIAEALAYPSPSKVEQYRMTIASQREQIKALEKNTEAAQMLHELKAFIEEQKNAIPLDD